MESPLRSDRSKGEEKDIPEGYWSGTVSLSVLAQVNMCFERKEKPQDSSPSLPLELLDDTRYPRYITGDMR